MKQAKVYLFGFSKWKHDFIRSFLKGEPIQKAIFINPFFQSSKHLDKALKLGLDENSQIYIWGRKDFIGLEDFANRNNIAITRVEDGFIRSIDLGSNFTRPYSLVFDDVGIYFDATQPSRLENILLNYDFASNKKLMERASSIHHLILRNKLSKYNMGLQKNLNFSVNKAVALVVGQVEDDASIIYGANRATNLDLLIEVAKNHADKYIVYKPHPDVLMGNRNGNLSDVEVLKYCDEIVKDISVADVLDAVDEVHTLTSLVGFEGLLYGKQVYTYGMPFYASWGVTVDRFIESRRNRKLEVLELVAAAYILYPKYINPMTKLSCEVEVTIKELKKQTNKLDKSFSVQTNLKSFITRNKAFRWLSGIILVIINTFYL